MLAGQFQELEEAGQLVTDIECRGRSSGRCTTTLLEFDTTRSNRYRLRITEAGVEALRAHVALHGWTRWPRSSKPWPLAGSSPRPGACVQAYPGQLALRRVAPTNCGAERS